MDFKELRSNILKGSEYTEFYGVMGAGVGGTISGIVYVVSEYALPKLGYETFRGIPLTTVSRGAFKATVACFATASFFALALLMVKYVIFVWCGHQHDHDDF